jgi:GxxExxY protein
MIKEIPEEVDCIAREIVDAAFKVHSTLGPGLLESVYETCLCHELRLRGRTVDTQVLLPIRYEGLVLDAALKLDMLVDEKVIVELKAVEIMHPVFEAQLLTYLKLTGRRLGFLINFNVPVIKNGIKRMAL